MKKMKYRRGAESLLEASKKIDQNLEGRRARTRAEREEALRLMESELRSSLETRWRDTLARAPGQLVEHGRQPLQRVRRQAREE